MRYLCGHCSLGLGEDGVAVGTSAKEIIGIVERRLSPFIGEDGVCAGLHQVLNDQVVTIGCCYMERGVHLVVCLLVYVLTLTDNDANEVKFTIVGSLPDV